MTQSQTDTPSTEKSTETGLVPTVRGVLANPKASFADVLDALHAEPAYLAPKVTHVVPKPVAVSPPQVDALEGLVEKLDSAKWPTVRRALRRSEVEDLNALFADLSEAEKLLKAVREAARTAALNHRDVVAEDKGLVSTDTPTDKDGHYLVKHPELDGLFDIHSQSEVITTKVTPPSVSVSAESVFAHVDDDHAFTGEGAQVALTRGDYLAVTDQVRVVNEAKLLRRVADKPELAPLLAQTAVRKGGSLAITLGKNAG
jgi:hypothetical protein